MVTEEANFYEAINAESKASKEMEIFLKITQDTSIFKKMNIDIEKITHLKIEKKFIQLNGGRSTKL